MLNFRNHEMVAPNIHFINCLAQGSSDDARALFIDDVGQVSAVKALEVP
ncbi:hypothetical protein KPSA3_06015 [Pseudomonas syringae pv. actinidiae]|uniref:Uncharacterized protein n=1 Tax=Pseudomonas syringae pv. actinidiae TaxID=103796 RepID=A0AAN4TNJ4_PSESF|nr:hypothetical protein KPSA3_06015 [Pseudomonas syringae pv. actinidiae]